MAVGNVGRSFVKGKRRVHEDLPRGGRSSSVVRYRAPLCAELAISEEFCARRMPSGTAKRRSRQGGFSRLMQLLATPRRWDSAECSGHVLTGSLQQWTALYHKYPFMSEHT